MSAPSLGAWRWYLGVEEDDDEMGDYGTREAAISQGLVEHKPGDSFWIVEARMRVDDEDAMASGETDTAPFAETRGGAWISIDEDGSAVEDREQ